MYDRVLLDWLLTHNKLVSEVFVSLAKTGFWNHVLPNMLTNLDPRTSWFCMRKKQRYKAKAVHTPPAIHHSYRQIPQSSPGTAFQASVIAGKWLMIADNRWLTTPIIIPKSDHASRPRNLRLNNWTTSTGYKTQHLGSAQQLISVFVEVLEHVLSDAKACKSVSTISTMCHLQLKTCGRSAKIKLSLMSGMDLAQCICRCTHVRWFWRTDHQALWPSIHSAFWIPFPLAMSRPMSWINRSRVCDAGAGGGVSSLFLRGQRVEI